MSSQGAVQLDISINGKSLSIDKQNLVSLNVNRVVGDSANEFTLEIFDETAYQVEQLLFRQGISSITVMYSAADDLDKNHSMMFTGVILTYNVSLVGRATMLSLEGVLTCGMTANDTVNWWFNKQSICWADPDTADGVVTIEETDSYGNPCIMVSPTALFERIIYEYNKANPGSFLLASGNDHAKHIPVSDLSTTQMNQTAADYITNVICPAAISDDGMPGFQYYVDGEGHHFKKAAIWNSVNAAKTYSMKFGEASSRIISFSLAETGALVMAGDYKDSNGNLLTSMSCLDKVYGQSVFQNYQSSSNINSVQEQVGLYTDTNLLLTSMIEIKSSSSQEGISANFENKLHELETLPFEATLTIWGEYSADIAPGNYVSLIITDNQGREHYATGSYYIIEVQDQISSSGYIQTLTLFKKSDKFIETEFGKKVVSEEKESTTGVTSLSPQLADKLQKVNPNESKINTTNNSLFNNLQTSEPVPITNNPIKANPSTSGR